jgi:PAS domain S-box-containing protein
MDAGGQVNILLVDDQPAKLLSYEVVLRDLNENLIKANSAQEALEHLLKNEIAVVLVDVCMPDLDGFQLAAMIRDHPRFKTTAIIFISAILLSEVDHLKGYEMGAVDYVPVPVVPEVLRAKVRVFVDLFRKTRQLEVLNQELERRVSERTAALESSSERLRQSEERRSLALAAGRMGAWDWDLTQDKCIWDESQNRIFGVDARSFVYGIKNIRALIHPEDWPPLWRQLKSITQIAQTLQAEFRICRPDGELRWCLGTAAGTFDDDGRLVRISGVTIDISDRKEAEERQALLAREVDHRARNALAVTQSIIGLTRAKTIDDYVTAVQGRVGALARAHTLLSHARWQGTDLLQLAEEELAPYRMTDRLKIRIAGEAVSLPPAQAQSVALVLHELATNAAKYGALSTPEGRLDLQWEERAGKLHVHWAETGGPPVKAPAIKGFGSKIIMATVVSQLGGSADLDWRPEGLVCDMVLSLRSRSEISKAAKARTKRKPRGPQRGYSSLSSMKTSEPVLVVEDEALVAMMMQQLLGELGFSDVVLCSRVDAAAKQIAAGDFGLAILDVNVANESIYPVADVLTAQNVPLIFITGYSPENIEPRFPTATILQKPLDPATLKATLISRIGVERPRAKISAAS